MTKKKTPNLRDLWLSECWKPVRQYDPGRTERAPVPPIPCPKCGMSYKPSYLATHTRRTHPQTVDETAESVDGNVA